MYSCRKTSSHGCSRKGTALDGLVNPIGKREKSQLVPTQLHETAEQLVDAIEPTQQASEVSCDRVQRLYDVIGSLERTLQCTRTLSSVIRCHGALFKPFACHCADWNLHVLHFHESLHASNWAPFLWFLQPKRQLLTLFGIFRHPAKSKHARCRTQIDSMPL